jgi:hypothetical protein
LYGQSSTPEGLHQQGIITARIIYIQRKVNQTNGKENVLINKYQVYIFPEGKKSKIYDQVCIGRESKDVVDDNTNHRGARMVFLTMNSINTWGKIKC